MTDFFRSSGLLLVLLNPFLMLIYLLPMVEHLSDRAFAGVLARGALISTFVFVAFAWVGDAVFTDVLQVRFAAFLIFGGVVFVIIGIRMIFTGAEHQPLVRGNPEYLAGTIAMPFMIGPGTVGASVLIGGRMNRPLSALAVVTALITAVLIILVLRATYDHVRQRKAKLVEHYIDIAGRITALITGTFAIEMILRGIDAWLAE